MIDEVVKVKKMEEESKLTNGLWPDGPWPITIGYDSRKQEHDVVLREIGVPVEGDGQEHSEIMSEITGH